MKESFIVAHLAWKGAKKEDMIVPKAIQEYREKHNIVIEDGPEEFHPENEKEKPSEIAQQESNGKSDGTGRSDDVGKSEKVAIKNEVDVKHEDTADMKDCENLKDDFSKGSKNPDSETSKSIDAVNVKDPKKA